MKKRVHELAKEYGMSSKDFLILLKDEIKLETAESLKNLSGLSVDDVERVRKYFEEMTAPKESVEEKGVALNKKLLEEDEIFEEERASKKSKKNKKNNKKESFDGNDEERGKKNKKKKGRRTDFVMKTVEAAGSETIEEDGMKIIKIRGEITLGDFAERLGVASSEIIKKLFLKGQMLTINSPLSIETVEEIAMDYDALVEQEEEVELEFGEKFALEVEDRVEDLQERPPVITIMGHVDHGKTSLLDAIRASNVVEGEAGGITQKIGAYQIVKNGKKITFVDTPGHEAFTDMRARGAQVTDIAILVVAADDGVMPQTIEALSHAKAANVPIIVAVNKIDKPEANPMRVKQELMEHGLVSVEWGGDTEFVEVSAKQKLHLDDLLDTILITAEILELKANPRKRAKGVVLESRLDPKVGPIADILVQEGTLKIGDVIVAGETYGKVRALLNDKGERVEKVELSQPAEIIGFTQVPQAGDTMYVIQNEQHAKRIVEEVAKERKLAETSKKTITLESLSEQFDHENLKELNLVELNESLRRKIPLEPITLTDEEKEKNDKEALISRLQDEAMKVYHKKEKDFNEFAKVNVPEEGVELGEEDAAIFNDGIREVERVILLKVIDSKWMNHIDDMDQLRESIGLQSYAQKDPVVQYKFLGYDMFEEMTKNIRHDTVGALMHVQIEQKVERKQVARATGTNKDELVERGPYRRKEAKIGRNAPCPCGSGKKYKNCCGRFAN